MKNAAVTVPPVGICLSTPRLRAYGSTVVFALYVHIFESTPWHKKYDFHATGVFLRARRAASYLLFIT